MKEIILRLGNGSLETGFSSVNVELRDQTPRNTQSRWEATTSLPASPTLKIIYTEWHFLYQASLQHSGQRGVKFAAATMTNFSIQDIQQITHDLTIALNDWLNQGDFYKIQSQLRTNISANEPVTITIVTADLLLWQLPWQRWNFFQDYEHCVEVFCQPQFKSRVVRPLQRNGRVDILAIWGNAPELDLAQDLAALNQPKAYVQSYQPQSALQISDQLAAHPVDILFFGGHGETIELELDGGAQTLGTIYLDKNTPIAISKIKQDLKQAVDRGLQIAIFNCCSGLGLAQELADLSIPYLIVMRSQIPDQLAQQFCQDLLKKYSQGSQFTTAFQYARRRLKPATNRTDEFESWLPMLFHNPHSDPVIWPQLCARRWSVPLPPSIVQGSSWLLRHRPIAWAGISVVAAAMASSLQSLAPIQNVENLLIDRMQAAQVVIRPTASQVVVINIANQADQSDGRVVPDDQYIAGDTLLQDLLSIPFLALGLDVSVEKPQPGGLLDKPYVSHSCTEEPPALLYQKLSAPDCPALAWAVAKNYAAHQQLPLDEQKNTPSFVLNPHLASTIPQINLSDIAQIAKSEPAKLQNKILLVGTFTDSSSPVMLQAIATEQIVRSIATGTNTPQSLTIPASDAIEVVYILLWSSLGAISIFQRRWLWSAVTSMFFLSIGTGWLLFSLGHLLPLLPTVLVIIISSSLVYLISLPSNSTSLAAQ